MKRGGPLKRRTQLRAKQGLQPGKALARTKRLARQAWGTPPGAQATPAARAADAAASGAWHAAATANGCEVCKYEQGMPLAYTVPGCDTSVQGHHPLPQQHIKRYVKTQAHKRHLGKAEAALLLRSLLWDKRNRLGVCTHRHESHTNGTRPISGNLLHPDTWVFADALGLGHVLARLHPVDGKVLRQ